MYRNRPRSPPDPVSRRQGGGSGNLEFAVFNAVSARPLRAPWVEMKYWRTFRPSRKFAVIGVSMIEPSGLAIRPRMPASWRICAAEPRAPESAIMKIELNES